MCGICGFIDFSKQSSGERLASTVRSMADRIVHRGPNDRGEWVSPASGAALGHRRLSIIDLSPEGHQPMVSANGRFVVAFNGEIYNFQKLREELASYPFRGHSDTEVMLAAFERWGIAASLERFDGMFAFAVWDDLEKNLTLARDRFGEKPLYYGWSGRSFFFASELKALRAHPEFRTDIDREALSLFLRFGYVPEPHSIHRDVKKLPPATYLIVKGDAPRPPEPYWSLRSAAAKAQKSPFQGTEDEAIGQLDRILRRTVSERMVSDVPLGAFLSGGIDSSLVVALMQAQSGRPIRTFTIGFQDGQFDESGHAREVARSLGTEHTELIVTPKETQDVVPLLPELYDEPFADSSQIPTFLVSKLARRDVTVSVTGDGGDELFGGYNRYFWGDSLRKRTGGWPRSVRRGLSALIRAASPRTWDRLFAALCFFLPREKRESRIGYKLQKVAEGLKASSPWDMYLAFVSRWTEPLVLGETDRPPTALESDSGASFSDSMMQWDAAGYLPGDILAKVDRASMGVSLEVRTPYLDRSVWDFAWSLPPDFKIRDGRGKWILRRLLDRYVPARIMERPKRGFALPIGEWLRTDLRDWAETLLSESSLKSQGYLDPAPIRRKWTEHKNRNRDWQDLLWAVLMFQAWISRWSRE